ncbi:GNAT family N-acetyltransferase [Agarivorans sp. QJM3NY_25]|uniref:GNAT family N-acetyltransferase n=1 Tax=Agarivorans sp. QJM3NY_25 TaxID=3421430 RepID=UPI003D7C44F7
MLTLRPMKQNEYPAYCEYFIDDYSREIAENYGHPIDLAIEMAQKALQLSFPNGLDTKQHALLCLEISIDSQSNVVGYLWHAINTEDQATFIYDFYVNETYRGRGYAKQAIALLEAQLQQQSIKQIKLRVAYQNKRALKLYQALGFSISGFNMSKILEGPSKS